MLGLIVLAVVSGVIASADLSGALSYGAAGVILLKAGVFLVGSLTLGMWLSPRLFHLASRLRARRVLLAFGLALCFLLAWLSGKIGLAPIVGAFAGGLILEDLHYRDFVDRGEHCLEELIHRISSFLVPVFFVLMGDAVVPQWCGGDRMGCDEVGIAALYRGPFKRKGAKPHRSSGPILVALRLCVFALDRKGTCLHLVQGWTVAPLH
ncbi:MAG: cation:proton antiporter [Acidobacteria bacterium]|nr:cation:proton antiporter [Acidobacteriota bacterium]